jgi:hypothetical protein
MTFDSKLSWIIHLKKLRINYKNKMKIIKTLSHLTWGAEKKPTINIQNTNIIKN